ncbi:hypothetical protein N7495_009909 [Penicillium taxi]|uniref:uncharacterized protein n=1 Tax=Penicillium taxi TaxID=168475 RepID=UPI00254563EC|nr:uncharacterized protein N7495_009909 [Penicillium taxi]KAJ5885399.1 hypothetical protein N7495_009909 [Penicillium taxi]
MIASASGTSEAQYLMLRSYRGLAIIPKYFAMRGLEFGMTPAILQSADEIFVGSVEWHRFLEIVESGDTIDDIFEDNPRWPGSFEAAQRLQEQAETEASSLTRRGLPIRKVELPMAEDEATVNTSEIVFLQAISHLAKATFTSSNLEWVHNRVHLSCPVQNGFESFTDRALRSRKGDSIFGIVEAKKRSREQDDQKISIQETCQLASWHMKEAAVQQACFNGQ